MGVFRDAHGHSCAQPTQHKHRDRPRAAAQTQAGRARGGRALGSARVSGAPALAATDADTDTNTDSGPRNKFTRATMGIRVRLSRQCEQRHSKGTPTSKGPMTHWNALASHCK